MKKNYMTRLEGWARWMLPRQEAEDVIADYRDIVSDPELLQGLGKPHSVVKPLVQTRQYRVWLAVFAVMAACILTLGISPTAIGYPFWMAYFTSWRHYHSALAVALLGAVLALVWFRWQGFKSPKRSKAIPILLVALTAWTGALVLVGWLAMRDPAGFSEALGQVPSLIGPDRMVSLSAEILSFFLTYGSVLMALLGTFALVRARTQDRRWAAVYVLALAAMMVCLDALALFAYMGPLEDLTGNWYQFELAKYAAIYTVGLVGTGVALC